MRSTAKSLGCLLPVLLIPLAARALVPLQPRESYQTIPDRNLFGLKAPQEATNEPSPPQVPKLLLTGITTILGDKRVLLKELPLALKPGEAPKEQSLILSEGQREAGVQVLSIDENAGRVKVDNAGTIMTLSFEKDGAKLPPSSAPASAPAGLPTPNGTAPIGPQPYGTNPRGWPQRPERTAPPAALPARPAVSPPPADASLPPTGASKGTVPAQNLPADLTPQEQTIILELQRQANQNNSSFPPLPPTSLTPGANGSSTAGTTTPAVPRVISPQ